MLPDSSAGKECTCNAGDPDSIPGSGRSLGEGKPPQYSGLENSMGCVVHGVAKSLTQRNDFPYTSLHVTPSVCRHGCSVFPACSLSSWLGGLLCGLSLFPGLTSLTTVSPPQALCPGLQRCSLCSMPTATFNLGFLFVSGLAPIDPSVHRGSIAHLKNVDPDMSLSAGKFSNASSLQGCCPLARDHQNTWSQQSRVHWLVATGTSNGRVRRGLQP